LWKAEGYALRLQVSMTSLSAAEFMAYGVHLNRTMDRKPLGRIDRSCSHDELLDHLVLGVLLIGNRLHLAEQEQAAPDDGAERRRTSRRVGLNDRRQSNRRVDY